jgi:ADP-ribosylglycohydrolase
MANVNRTLPSDYRDRVYAGWLGKCIGVHFGGPLESWTYEAIRDNLGEVETYLQPSDKVFKPDDDLVMPLIMMRAFEECRDPVSLSAEEIGHTWVNYLSRERGSIWRGGYGVSSEHTAYLNLLNGIPAPQSGSAALNGPTISEQIGGQIFSDIWGLVYPNQPQLAADLSEKAASISHDGEGINGARFVAALASVAFSESDPQALIRAALGVIPGDSEYARVTQAMLEWHAQHPDDWRSARGAIERDWGYDRYPGVVPIIPNAAIIMVALLYGGGDFSRTIQIANMCGWDTDCNVGNVGGVMGVAVGLVGIADHWRRPLNDSIVSASVVGVRNISDIAHTADYLGRVGRILAGGKVEQETLPRLNFDFPGSTHGLLIERIRCRVAMIQQSTEQAYCGRGSLRIAIDRLDRKGELRLYLRTHYHVDELTSNHYEASFSSAIYPGQRISAQVYVPNGTPELVHAALFAHDRLRGAGYQAPGTKLQAGQWNQVVVDLPPMDGVCFSEVGLVIRSLAEDPWSGVLFLDAMDWGGPANYALDLGQQLPNGRTTAGWTTLAGYWRVEDGAYWGSGVEQNESYTGDFAWEDYAVTVHFQPVRGDHHGVNVRVRGARQCYLLGFVGEGRVGLYKKEAGLYRELLSVPYDWQLGGIYSFRVVASGERLQLAIDGETVLEHTDVDAPYLQGQIGLANGPGCRTRFERLQVRPAGAA